MHTKGLIDRLLASPRYGERWGRHWLDVARYSDSVNDSVNAGQRYPVVVHLSRLGDPRVERGSAVRQVRCCIRLRPTACQASIRGTWRRSGFLSLGREFPKSYPETVDDRIDAVTRGMLGLTVSCARCHDHKYDPIPTKDYYSLYSIFSNIREPEELPLLGQGRRSSRRSTRSIRSG